MMVSSESMRIKNLEDENVQLKAQIERLRDLALSCGTGRADEFEAVIESTPQQSLAEHGAEVAKKAILSVLEIDHSYLQTGEGQFAFYDYGIESHAEQYANKIRNGKDGE